MNVKQFVPRPCSVNLSEMVNHVSSPKNFRAPFSQEIIEFCDQLSKTLFNDSETNEFPAIQALAFWLRRASILKMQAAFRTNLSSNTIQVPRGLTFHICPANVDTIFIYSWIISLLCGNANILRLSQTSSRQIELLCAAINRTLDHPALEVLRNSVSIITYGHDAEITKAISQASDTRVIWGGDGAVNFIRSIPGKVSTKDIPFRDRNSLSIIKAQELVKSTADERSILMVNFFNDAYWFNQMACSSPRSIVWVGDTKTIGKARELFIDGLKLILQEKLYHNETGTNLERMTSTYFNAAKERPVTFRFIGNEATFFQFGNISTILREHDGAGIFYDYEVSTLTELAPYIIEKDQTLGYFGFQNQELEELVKMTNGVGIDRIVPIGSALTFSWNWDGFDLFQEFTRKINLQS